MQSASALSPEVLQYLESIKGAPCFFEKFLSSDDFVRMCEFAKDFGGIEVVLPRSGYTLVLNVFGVLTFNPSPVVGYGVSALGASESGDEHRANVRDFLNAVRKYAYPGIDRAWCATAIVQACYDSASARVREAMGRSTREE